MDRGREPRNPVGRRCGPATVTGTKRRLVTPLTAGAVGKASPAARSQETTFVRATFAEPRGRSWWRSGVFLTRARCGHSSGRSVRFVFSLAIISVLLLLLTGACRV